MIEREMEDLISSFPDDFFPGRGFQLMGRQQPFEGVGRFDLLFEDRFKTKILMELKAVPAKYEVASQLAKYMDEMRNRGEQHILMWLVAPQVPNSVRQFLDRIGIEYSELHEVEFRRVAERHGIPFAVQESSAMQNAAASASDQQFSKRENTIFKAPKKQSKGVLFRSREAIRAAIHQLWSKQQRLVTRDQLASHLKEQEWTSDVLLAKGVSTVEEQQKRIENWVDWFSSEYDRELYGLSDEFIREKISSKWAYRPRVKSM